MPQKKLGIIILYLLIVRIFLTALSCFIIALLISSVGIVLRIKKPDSNAKKSPFECGFIPKFRGRTPFSLQFFLIALIFLIFDIELILLFPILQTATKVSVRSLIVFEVFFFIIIYRFLVEWSQGILEWVK